MTAGYRQVDHTADLAIELWADTEEALLAIGAQAVVEILTDGAEVAERVERPVYIEAVDREDRLVQWLNEVLVAAVTEGFLCGRASIELGPGALRAVMYGESGAADKVVTELKSVTYHGLALGQEGGGWRGHVVIDV